MRIFLLIIAVIVGATCGYGYGIVVYIGCRIVGGIIVEGAKSSSSYKTYESHKYQSRYQNSYQNNYQNSYQHNNNARGGQKTESKGIEYYYSVLGVSSKATDAEVKKAYRKLAMECHPDHYANSSEEVRKHANERFREVNKAYEAVKELRQMK